MARQIPDDEVSGLVKRVAADLDRPRHAWWRTAAWQRIRTDHGQEPFVQVLVAFANRLKAGVDVAWLTGGSTGTDAVAMGREWVDSGVSPEDVEDWLSAGCWNARTAREMADADLVPGDLMEGDSPLIFESPGRVPAPLAEHVIDGTVSIEDAVAFVNAHRGGAA